MPGGDDDLYFSTIGELNARLRKREISAKELARTFSARLERLGPQYNALALPLSSRARKLAKDVDDEIHRERFRGAVQGIPFGAKDLFSLAGFPTTWGAKPYANQTFKETATVLRKLEGSGALLIGKLAMVELAGGPSYRFASASLTGPGLNPWDRTRWSGGSSSGSAIAVGAGLTVFALGSETSGSILTPSAFCGVPGLRPPYGLVSRPGAMALSWPLDKIGPIARCAEDCGFVLDTIAGGDRDDPGSSGHRFFYQSNYQHPLNTIRIGYAPADFTDHPEPGARPVFTQALETMRGLGFPFVEKKLPDFPYGPMLGTILSAEAASIFEPLIRSGDVNQLADAHQIAGLKAALDIKATDYLKAMRIRRLFQDAMRDLFSDCDILLAPTRPGVAPPVDRPLDRPPAGSHPAQPNATPAAFGALIPAGNLAGLPALSLPCGFDNTLPLAIQLVGQPYSENLLIHAGKAFQRATDWHRRRPPAL